MPPPITSTLPGATPGTPPSSRPAAAERLLEEVRARLRGETSCDLAHRREKRQPAIGRLDGLVRNSRDAAVDERARQRLVGGDVQVGEEHEPLPQARILLGDRLLHLEQELGVAPDVVDRRRSCAPTRSYAASGNALPTPAPVSTTTSWPRLTSSRAPAGVSATRYSSVLISFATPIFTAGEPYTGARVGTISAQTRDTPADTIAVGGGFGVPR